MIDFSPLLESDNIAVRFSSVDEADNFLRELYSQYGKRFQRRTNYWDQNGDKTVYIPRLHTGSNMTYARYNDVKNDYTVIHYNDLVLEDIVADFSEEDLATILLYS